MIRIKVFSLRQAINNLIFAIIIFSFIIFIIFIFCALIYLVKEEIKERIIEDTNMLAYEVFSKESLIDNILKNEILAFSALANNDLDTENQIATNNPKYQYDYAQSVAQSIDGTSSNVNNIIDETENEKLNIEIKEAEKEYALPEKYDVEKYENGNVKVGNTKITNYSKLNLNLTELSKPSDIKITADSNFLVFHTHATESYTITDNPEVVNYRTTDEKYNMISVGKVLLDCLIGKNFECVQDSKLHDYPSYNGAYKSSLATVQEYIKDCEYDFVIDIHRDALSSNLGFKPTVEINGEKAAKLMFVIGTNAAGLEHDEWMKNLKLALMIQNRANEMYPGLFRDLHLSNSRYNQHVSNGAFIIEVGATGNTLDEAKNAMKYLANVINSFK